MREETRGTGHIRLKRVFCKKARFEDGSPGRTNERWDPASPLAFSVGLTTWVRREVEVRVELSVTIEPDHESGQPYHVELSYVGDFELHLDRLPEGLDRESFAEQNAAAILFPYVREAVTGLTSRGSAGPLFIPPVNVVAMLQRREERESSQAIPS